MVTSTQISKGLARFIKSDMAKAVSGDAGAKGLLSMLAAAVEVKPDIIDGFLHNEMLKSFWRDEHFDIDSVIMIMSAAAKDGGFKIVLPPIPLLSPSEKHFLLSAEDFHRLFQYIEEA